MEGAWLWTQHSIHCVPKDTLQSKSSHLTMETTTSIQLYKRTYHVQDVDWFSVVLQLVSLKNLQVINSSFSPFSFKQFPGFIIHRFVVQEEKETSKTLFDLIYFRARIHICRILMTPLKCSSSLVIHNRSIYNIRRNIYV